MYREFLRAAVVMMALASSAAVARPIFRRAKPRRSLPRRLRCPILGRSLYRRSDWLGLGQ